MKQEASGFGVAERKEAALFIVGEARVCSQREREHSAAGARIAVAIARQRRRMGADRLAAAPIAGAAAVLACQ